MTRRRAERLLSRRAYRGDRLGPLVDAAAAPATPAELGREQEAVALFLAAAERDAAVAEARPAPVLRGAARFSTRVGIAAAAVFATVTGLAVAAGAGVLPNRLQRPAHDIFHAPAPSERTQQSPSTAPSSRTTTRTSPASPSSASASSTATSSSVATPTGRTTTSAVPSKSSPSASPSITPTTPPTSTTRTTPTKTKSPAPTKTETRPSAGGTPGSPSR